MLSLPLELKIVIASNDEETWFLMWLYDEDFRNRTQTESFRKKFVNAFSASKIDHTETQTWWLLGKCHRGVTSYPPAVVYSDGSQGWWKYGKRHRGNDLPAVIWGYGSQEWWVNDKRHRENDAPAVIFASGYQEWWRDGKLHRENDLPAIIWGDGGQQWWYDGKWLR